MLLTYKNSLKTIYISIYICFYKKYMLSLYQNNELVMKHELQEVLAIVNNKGGVGKTSTVQSLAAGLLRMNKKLRVLVIDLDPQGNLSQLCGWNSTSNKNKESKSHTIYDALRDAGPIPVNRAHNGVYYSASSPKLQQVEIDLYRQMQPKQVLVDCFRKPIEDQTGEDEKLGKIIDTFDYVFIDCPPALSETTYNAMAVASGVIVPVQMESLAISGLGNILVEIGRVKKGLNADLEIRGILPVMVDSRSNIVKGFLEYLKSSYEKETLNSYIRRGVKMNEAQNKLMDIFEYAPYCQPAIDYENLVKELFNDK